MKNEESNKHSAIKNRPQSSGAKRDFPPSIPKNESTKVPLADEEPQKPPP